MERRVFNTIINKTYISTFNGREIKCNDYILGRIMGFSNILCDSDYGVTVMIANGEDDPAYDTRFWFTVNTTEEQYEQFKQLVEKCYPGLCEFNTMVYECRMIFVEH